MQALRDFFSRRRVHQQEVLFRNHLIELRRNVGQKARLDYPFVRVIPRFMLEAGDGFLHIHVVRFRKCMGPPDMPRDTFYNV